MADYYQILGIDPSADSTQIRAAYKKMAMLYHPDRNAGNPEAEEKFKAINEAYHVLSDPLKKTRYDARMGSFQTVGTTEAYWREVERQRYFRWKAAQAAERKRYRFDKNYFRIQGLAFLVFIVLAGFCFAVIHTINFFIEQNHKAKWQANTLQLQQVRALYGNEKFDEAFALIKKLKEEDPMEFRFGFTRDSLIAELRMEGDSYMRQQDFQSAMHYYEVLQRHEQPPSLETLGKIASCQFYLGNFDQSLVALKHLHNQQPWDLDLIYKIGLINLENLHNNDEALHYFDLGKKLFKKNLSEVYGEAFEIVMDPTDAPDVYFDIFKGRATTNLRLKRFDEAITDCNWAIFLRPLRGEMYQLRAFGKFEVRRAGEACEDLQKAADRGVDVAALQRSRCR